jgi:bla regulator protein BlaR1
MNALQEAIRWFFPWLWQASCQASVVIILLLALQRVLRKHLTPRWSHALWLLVVIRLVLPFSVETPFSLFNWIPNPGSAQLHAKLAAAAPASPVAPDPTVPDERPAAATSPKSPWIAWLAGIWLAGAVALPCYSLLATWRLGRKVWGQRPVTDQAILNLLEDCKQEMRVRTPLSLIETSAVSGPSLLGFIRPRLLLPAGLISAFSRPELRYVFLHELGHVKRGDIILNWLITVPLCLHWFNPLVWFAFHRMRADREVACDALALSHAGDTENRSYGQTIIKLLENFSRPAIAPALAGILETKNQMQRRISMIAKFKKTNRWPVLAASACAVLALVTLTDAISAQPGGGASGTADDQGPPQIVSTTPEVGATEIDPAITEITVKFDRDMGGGFSWTGGGPDYPPTPTGQKATWRDKRTCVLPVKLEAGRYYRVGINSTSYQNFRSAAGVPARPSAVYFTTRGASEELKRKAQKPVIVGLTPKNGAQDVDPNLTEIRVTFNVPMGGGFSWTGGGEKYPTIPEGKKPFWTDDKKTCVLPVQLKPGWEYRLGLNSPSHKNFQSAGGVPLDPVVLNFKTR